MNATPSARRNTLPQDPTLHARGSRNSWVFSCCWRMLCSMFTPHHSSRLRRALAFGSNSPDFSRTVYLIQCSMCLRCATLLQNARRFAAVGAGLADCCKAHPCVHPHH